MHVGSITTPWIIFMYILVRCGFARLYDAKGNASKSVFRGSYWMKCCGCGEGPMSRITFRMRSGGRLIKRALKRLKRCWSADGVAESAARKRRVYKQADVISGPQESEDKNEATKQTINDSACNYSSMLVRCAERQKAGEAGPGPKRCRTNAASFQKTPG